MSTMLADGRRQYPASTLARAREHFAAGWKYPQIPALLDSEGLGCPSVSTVYQWVYPVVRERHVDAMRDRNARAAAVTASYRLRGRSPEYQLEFMQRLRREGIPCSSIAKVCRVVLGINVSREFVRDQLKPSA